MYLKGKYLYRTRQSLDDRAEARALFEKAIELDPNLIKAKVILGETYYVDGDFMSRIDIDEGHISLHPMGIPHGPHPGAMERSIGQTKTNELAVMVDTFHPLKITEEALKLDDGKYYKSWIE